MSANGKGKCFRKHDQRSAADEDVAKFWEAGDVESTGIFPEEVWYAILGYLEHSQDIVNVLRAFPKLDKAFQRKKPFWLFDQVLPHLMTKQFVVKTQQDCMEITFSHKKGWIQSPELLKLRLVSKRWKKVVDRSLETNNDFDLQLPHLLLPYRPEQLDDMNVPNIQNTLRLLPISRKIRKLSLSSLSSHLQINVIDLVETLADFQFETVNIERLLLKENSIAVTLAPEIPVKLAETITSLYFCDNDRLTYEFLWWLPNLRFLSVHFRKEAAISAYCRTKMEENTQDPPLENRLRRYGLKAYDKTLVIPEVYSIWEEFPNLEVLRGSVEVGKDSIVLGVQYVRKRGNKAFFRWRSDVNEEDNNGFERIEIA